MNMNFSTNIIPFTLPSAEVTFYFSIVEDNSSHRMHVNVLSEKVVSALDLDLETEFVYTTFNKETAGYTPLVLKLAEEKKSFAKRFYNYCIQKYFEERGILVKKNFVSDVQVWIPQDDSSSEFSAFERFTIRTQFNKITDNGELLISYDGTSQVLKQSINQAIDIQPEHLGYVLQENKLLRFHDEGDYQLIDHNLAYPVMKLNIYRDLNLPLPQIDKSNKYKKFIPKISTFANQYLEQDSFRAIIDLAQTTFYQLPATSIGTVRKESNNLVFANSNIDTDARQGIKKGPFKKSSYTNVHFFFIYHKDSTDAARNLHKYYKDGVDFFKGLESISKVRYYTEKNFSIVFKDIDNPIPEIQLAIDKKEWKDDVEYFAIYLSPYDKHEPDKQKRQIYYSLKKILLDRKIHSQVIVEQKMIDKGSEYKYSMTNIAVATLAKLGGVPWRIQSSLKNELVVGVGAFKSIDTGLHYVGSAFSFQNNGEFNEFDCFLKTDTDILAGAIQEAIIKFASVNKIPERLIIHFYKDMSQEEIKPIMNKLFNLGLQIPVFIITINKTESSDVIAWDNDWVNLMPISGTFIKVGWNEYLLFNNTRYGEEHKSADGFPFPVKMKVSCTESEQLTTPVVRELIDQVYQFSKMYWKSVKQQHLPVTIKYPEMVAKIFPHLEVLTLPEFGKDKLWFL